MLNLFPGFSILSGFFFPIVQVARTNVWVWEAPRVGPAPGGPDIPSVGRVLQSDANSSLEVIESNLDEV